MLPFRRRERVQVLHGGRRRIPLPQPDRLVGWQVPVRAGHRAWPVFPQWTARRVAAETRVCSPEFWPDQKSWLVAKKLLLETQPRRSQPVSRQDGLKAD